MPQTTLYDRKGKSLGSVDLSDLLFARPSTRRSSTRWQRRSSPAPRRGPTTA